MGEWDKWLKSEQTHREFTGSQIDRATYIVLYVPKYFGGGPPSAMPDEDETLCLTWRNSPWTLHIEINLFGDTEWLAYNTETRETINDYKNITSHFRIQGILESVQEAGVLQEGWVSKSQDGVIGIEWGSPDKGFLVTIEGESLTWLGFDEKGFYDFDNLDSTVSWFLDKS